MIRSFKQEISQILVLAIGSFLFLLFAYPSHAAPGTNGVKTQVQESYGRLPLSFIRNEGQVDQKVKFYEKGSGHTTFFTQEGVYLSLVSGPRPEVGTPRPTGPDRGPAAEPKAALLKLIPLGAKKHPPIVAEGLQEGKVNYFIGNDPKRWKRSLPTYQAVVYQELYPGIDMKFYGNNRQLEYDIVIKPGADPSKVRLAYEGVKGLKLTEEGGLLIELSEGSILQNKPLLYQEIEGKRVPVDGGFKLLPSRPPPYSPMAWRSARMIELIL